MNDTVTSASTPSPSPPQTSNDGPSPSRPRSRPRTLATDLLETLRDDPDLNDVTLVGTDSVSIPANKSILSARSDVFRRLFYGDFVEGRAIRSGGSAIAAATGDGDCSAEAAPASSINVGFEGEVLAMVVEWCYSDDLAVLSGEEHQGRRTTTENNIRTVVRAVGAADYFALEEMEIRATEWIVEAVHAHPGLACAVLDEAHATSDLTLAGSEMCSSAWEVIRLRSKDALLPPPHTSGRGVLALGPDVIECVIDDHMTTANELVMFQCLERWAADSPYEQVPMQLPSPSQQVGGKYPTQTRRERAVELVKKINLSQILPSDLHDIVAPSDLIVGSDRITEAYREQALLAESNGTFARDVPLSQPRWGAGKATAMTTEDSSLGSRQSGRSRITVSGAGRPEVDGVYRARGWFGDAPRYCKVGFWEGRVEQMFTIVRLDAPTDGHGAVGSGRWYLTVAHVGKKPLEETSEWVFLYVSPALGEGQEIWFPGGVRWEPASDGQEPGPIVSWQA